MGEEVLDNKKMQKTDTNNDIVQGSDKSEEKEGTLSSRIVLGVVGYCMLIVSLQVLNVRVVEYFTKENSNFDNAYISTKTLIGIVLIVTILFLKLKMIKIDFSPLKISASTIKELKISALLVVVIVVGLIAVRLVYQQFNSEVAERPFFGWYFTYHTRWFYPINSFLQECFIRLVIQDNLKKLEDSSTKNYSLYLVAFFFASLHMAYPWYMMFGTALYCMLTGVLYNKYKCIYCLTIVHFAAGFLPRCFGII